MIGAVSVPLLGSTVNEAVDEEAAATGCGPAVPMTSNTVMMKSKRFFISIASLVTGW
ncbi:hypothetical protein FD02_GL000684 [Lacticaseibacillus nasuensis JCM 17158]|uniref:Uncharacterized protein n=1 Tax=Lacticaseibacillus nasuensis JCM 17158 TaxID=1291734 RepID=A0A0R1JTF5_9LACO|nr:hypothetical protein FD02_GL000684 [Lacticaseibacillus nasuensis JCM 17158]